MWSSSELSISRSMPVIFPAKLGCMFWISGKRRSPRGGHRGFKIGGDLHSPRASYWDNTRVVYNTQDTRYGFPCWGKTCLVRGRESTLSSKHGRAVVDTYPASASVPVVEQQPTWRRSEAPVPEHEQQAEGKDTRN